MAEVWAWDPAPAALVRTASRGNSASVKPQSFKHTVWWLHPGTMAQVTAGARQASLICAPAHCPRGAGVGHAGSHQMLSTQKPRKLLLGRVLPELQQPGLKAPPGQFFPVGYVPGHRAL